MRLYALQTWATLPLREILVTRCSAWLKTLDARYIDRNVSLLPSVFPITKAPLDKFLKNSYLWLSVCNLLIINSVRIMPCREWLKQVAYCLSLLIQAAVYTNGIPHQDCTHVHPSYLIHYILLSGVWESTMPRG